MLLGLERYLRDGHADVDGFRAGIVTNHTGVDSRLNATIDVLAASGRLHLRAIFSPEHGARGEAQAGAEVGSTTDERTGLPVHSLYGETRMPSETMLDGLDVVLFDIQDAGARFYTYLSTLVNVMRACADREVRFAVLDRPNPITGSRVEGPLLTERFASFVGCHAIPTRHGMTFGELARLIAHDLGLTEPVVIAMDGWRRDRWYDATALPWVPPSPNMPTLDTAALYPGTCLIEGTTLSEGRGTTRPFETIGAPWLDPYALVADLRSRDLPGVAFRTAWFTPTISKHAGESCGGVQVHITDRDALRPAALGVHLLHALLGAAGERDIWLQSVPDRWFVDLLFGSDLPRRMLSDGADPADVMVEWADQETGFFQRREPFLLYA